MRAARRQGVLGLVHCEQVIRQGCVLEALLFNIFFAAVSNVASAHFKANKGGMNTLEPPEGKTAGGEAGGGGGKQLQENQSWRRRFVACFMLTMPGSSRHYPRS